jgi:long-chain acyl-CoA synthetase
MSAPAAVDVPGLLSLVAARAEKPALTFYRGKSLEGRLTYGELSAKAEALAGRMHHELGVKAGDRVAILAPNRLEIPVLVLAILRLGAVVVPLNPGAAVDDWAYILRHSGARGLCATGDLLGRVPASSLPASTLRVEEAFAGGAAPPPASELAESMAVVLYTSGTTGNPKGVALRQRSLFWNAWSMAQNFRLEGTTQLAVLPLYHAHAFGFGLMTALATGGHLVFTERLEPFTVAEVLRREEVAVMSVVPTLIPMLLAGGVTRQSVPGLRHIMVSSAPLPSTVARDFETRTRIPLIQGWGLSEYTNFACCMSPLLSDEEHDELMFGGEIPSIGPSLEGTEVKVEGPDGGLAAEGERGELLIRGHSTMLGYFEDPDATARTIDKDGWLRTGDEGFFRLHDGPGMPGPSGPAGNGQRVHFVTGRLKEIIIRDAEKYSPLRLESRLLIALPELQGKLVVVGFAHKEHGEEVGAYVEMEAVDDELRTRLVAAVQSLPVAERPKVVLHGAEPVPRTHTGKVQRRKMQPWFAAYLNHRGAMVFEKRAP